MPMYTIVHVYLYILISTFIPKVASYFVIILSITKYKSVLNFHIKCPLISVS